MKARTIIKQLAQSGAELRIIDNRLKVASPGGLDEEQLEYLRQHKQELLRAIESKKENVIFETDGQGGCRQIAGEVIPPPTGRALSVAAYSARIREICQHEGIDTAMVLSGLQGETTPIYECELLDICRLFAGRLSIN